jgi:hypothetical protein
VSTTLPFKHVKHLTSRDLEENETEIYTPTMRRNRSVSFGEKPILTTSPGFRKPFANSQSADDIADHLEPLITDNSNQNSPTSSISSLNSMVLGMKTTVNTLYSKYSIVLAIDSSQSMAVVDPTTGEVLFDRVYTVAQKLTSCLATLDVQAHVTVISVGSHQSIVTILQDVIVTRDNLDQVIRKINEELVKIENSAANLFGDAKRYGVNQVLTIDVMQL